MHKHFLLFPIALLVLPRPLSAAPSGSQEQEYQQVRKIALRDPKVRAAYDEADRRLAAKITQIDPALRTYTPARVYNVAPPLTTKSKTPGTTHIVVKGETLGIIAGRYGVTVAALKTANQIPDERKLRAGQTLTIPHAQSH